MRVSTRFLRTLVVSSVIPIVLVGGAAIRYAQPQNSGRPTIATEADFRRAMKELSNWSRWGDSDELGAANLITPAKRKQALALAKEGLTISLDNLDFERAAEQAKRLNRYEFLLMAAPLRIDKGMGSPLNPLAIF